MSRKTLKCFISYSHVDQKLCNKFRKFFSNISRLIDTEDWYDGKILPGDVIDDEIERKLDDSDVIFLLISTDYIASYYCYEKELRRAIARHDAKQCVVIPVILRDFVRDEDYLFSKLKFVPTDGKAVTDFKTQNAGFVDAFTAIKNLLLEFGADRISANKASKNNVSTVVMNKNNSAATHTDASNTQIKYKIVKRGKPTKVSLSQEVFDEIVACGQKSAHLSTDMNRLTIESIQQFENDMTKTPAQLKHQFYRRNLESFLFQICGYIQHHFVGCDNTCIHFRVKDNNVYKDYFDIGYRKNGISVAPIIASDGMIECAFTNKMPVIKEFNKSLHKKSHPNEKIERNYVTFAFDTVLNDYNISLSMCISVIGPATSETNNSFTAMSLVRVDWLIERYILEYINRCSKLDAKYDIVKILRPEV